MHSATNPKAKALPGTYLSIFLLLAALFVVLFQTFLLSRESAQASLEQEARHRLSLYVSHLQGRLEKYESLPELLATDRRLVDLLEHPEGYKGREVISRYLKGVNSIIGAADTYLMDSDGLTVAASNWQSERTFLGKNFAYRPYFKEAMEGRLGRYFALGTTSKRRGYYFSYPVHRDGLILGAIVIKIEVSQIEENWAGSDDDYLVTDPDGVVFISTQNQWRFKTLHLLSERDKERISESRRYTGTILEPLGIISRKSTATGSMVVELEGAVKAGFLMLEQAMPEAGWKIHILTSMSPITRQINRNLMVVVVIFTLLALLMLYLNQRRRRLHERTLFEQQAKHQLEVRVQERTAELTESNIRLTNEITEHRRTEEALHLTQDELIQAAKMAALGQMATGISHELNQPLAAIRSYADNARALLQRERKEDACWNLEQIGELVKRVAIISSQLKAFARKTSGQLVSVSLPAAIDYSLSILAPRIKEVAAEVKVVLPEEEIFLHADMVQLEQVFVNLIGNALYAVEEKERRLITIRGTALKDAFQVTIHDSGSGIKKANLKQVFEPFFTTRDESRGLGLGLSISHRIVENMEGSLRADNHEDGGAVFILEMQLAEAPDTGQLND